MCSGSRECLQMRVVVLFIFPAHVPHPFVASGQDYDRDQGYKQRECSGHAPLWEDDAEVLGRPREEHLDSSVTDDRQEGLWLTFIEHWLPMSMSPWSMWPWSICEWSMALL